MNARNLSEKPVFWTVSALFFDTLARKRVSDLPLRQTARIALILLLALAAALWLMPTPRARTVSAEPHAQSTVAPTEEPTKPPYVFPTPVFIPIYPDDTPVPRATPVATRAPGQPAVGEQTYTVQPGDSPWTIAQKMYGDGTKYPLIMSANNLTSTTRLRVGAVLVIPPVSGSAPPPAPTAAPPAPTFAPPTLQPTAAPTFAAPTPQPTPTSKSLLPGSSTEIASAAINLLSGILAAGSVISAVLAYFAYARAQRIEQLASGKQPIRFRK